ncbi:MAG: 30S ribosomal protein S17 [Acidiferrobacteraceae bacterium]|jgi:small subunit ribosomal protein S17|nr:30S ribosomal protein S17 [Acidiferrobacteraceae bacterium]
MTTNDINSEVDRKTQSVVGSVLSARMDKSITVLTIRQYKHPLYKKYIRRSTKIHAHDEDNVCKAGDTVVIEHCRPISRTKSWRLLRILKRSEQE